VCACVSFVVVNITVHYASRHAQTVADAKVNVTCESRSANIHTSFFKTGVRTPIRVPCRMLGRQRLGTTAWGLLWFSRHSLHQFFIFTQYHRYAVDQADWFSSNAVYLYSLVPGSSTVRVIGYPDRSSSWIHCFLSKKFHGIGYSSFIFPLALSEHKN
jgi:hypothetical protein